MSEINQNFENLLDKSFSIIKNYALKINQELSDDIQLDPINVINTICTELVYRDNKNINSKFIANVLFKEFTEADKILEEKIWGYIVGDKSSEYHELNKILDLIDKINRNIVKKIIRESINEYKLNHQFYSTYQIEFYIIELKEIIKKKGKDYLNEMGKVREPEWFKNIDKKRKFETLNSYLEDSE